MLGLDWPPVLSDDEAPLRAMQAARQVYLALRVNPEFCTSICFYLLILVLVMIRNIKISCARLSYKILCQSWNMLWCYHRYTLRHLDPSMGLNLGGLRVFLVIKIIMVRQVRKLPVCTVVWAWKQSCVKSCPAREDRERICFVFAFACGQQNPEDPQIEPHGWRRHYTGRYRKYGNSGVYLWMLSSSLIALYVFTLRFWLCFIACAHMWHDQEEHEEWVRCWKYWFWIISWQFFYVVHCLET